MRFSLLDIGVGKITIFSICSIERSDRVYSLFHIAKYRDEWDFDVLYRKAWRRKKAVDKPAITAIMLE